MSFVVSLCRHSKAQNIIYTFSITTKIYFLVKLYIFFIYYFIVIISDSLSVMTGLKQHSHFITADENLKGNICICILFPTHNTITITKRYKNVGKMHGDDP